MKKIIMLAVFGLGSAALFAQEGEKKEKKESQEIVIRKSGDKNEKITVVVDGDNITVNGMPLSEFKSDDVKVLKRKSMSMRSPAQGRLLTPGDAFAWRFNDAEGGEKTSRPFLGVQTEDENTNVVKEVTKESAAEKAGLKKGDVITKIGDKEIKNFEDIADAVKAHKAKEEVTIVYKRDGKEKSTKAVLGERKDVSMAYSFGEPGQAYSFPRMPAMPPMHDAPNMHFDWDGDMDLTERLPKMQDRIEELYTLRSGRPKLGLKIQDTEEGAGVKVLEVEENSAAAKSGIKADDIITEIGGKKVTNTDEAREQLRENAEKSSYTVKAKRGGNEMSFEVKIPKKLRTTNL